jgi:hypothetical protein
MTLNPSTGVEAFERLLEEFRPVSNGTGKHASENEVELVTVCPLVFEVVDLEL